MKSRYKHICASGWGCVSGVVINCKGGRPVPRHKKEKKKKTWREEKIEDREEENWKNEVYGCGS